MENAFKEIINEAIKPVMKTAGFKKKALSFYKSENRLVYLINIQKSHGNSSLELGFYVNCCIHSNDISEELGQGTMESPKEYQCHFRQRIEQISENCTDKFLINSRTNLSALKSELTRCFTDAANYLTKIENNDLFVLHLSQNGTLEQEDIFRFCLRKNKVSEAQNLVDLVKKNMDDKRWNSFFKPQFNEIIKEEKSKIEIANLKD